LKRGTPISSLKVSATSNPNAVAGAFAGAIREHGQVEVHVVGAGALNQAMKAVAITRGYLLDSGVDVWCQPEFTEVQINGQKRTALRLLIQGREAGEGARENAGEGPGG